MRCFPTVMAVARKMATSVRTTLPAAITRFCDVLTFSMRMPARYSGSILASQTPSVSTITVTKTDSFARTTGGSTETRVRMTPARAGGASEMRANATAQNRTPVVAMRRVRLPITVASRVAGVGALRGLFARAAGATLRLQCVKPVLRFLLIRHRRSEGRLRLRRPAGSLIRSGCASRRRRRVAALALARAAGSLSGRARASLELLPVRFALAPERLFQIAFRVLPFRIVSKRRAVGLDGLVDLPR